MSLFLSLAALSILPSNPAVANRFASLKEERAAAKAAFRAAVDAASIEWEAEILLALEEFQEAGGFEKVQEQMRAQQVRLRRARDHGIDMDIARPIGHSGQAPLSGSYATHLKDLFLAERLELDGVLSVPSGTESLFLTGEPTMATERAALRVRILADVYKKINDAIVAELDDQEARERALVEERNRVRGEERQMQKQAMKRRMGY